MDLSTVNAADLVAGPIGWPCAVIDEALAAAKLEAWERYGVDEALVEAAKATVTAGCAACIMKAAAIKARRCCGPITLRPRQTPLPIVKRGEYDDANLTVRAYHLACKNARNGDRASLETLIKSQI